MKNSVIFKKLKIFVRALSVQFFQTRYPYQEAWKYSLYKKQCQWKMFWSHRKSEPSAVSQKEMGDAIQHFHKARFSTYRNAQTVEAARKAKAFLSPWFDQQTTQTHSIIFNGCDPWEIPGVRDLFTGDLRNVLEKVFGANFKLFYGIASRSVPVESPPKEGYNSFMWHADGGPPSCLNMMLYLDDTDKDNGAIEFGPNKLSVELLVKSVTDWRDLDQMGRTQKYTQTIDQHGQSYRAEGRAGTIVLFSNNLLHRGGLARERLRDVLIFHLYPAPQPFIQRSFRIKKTAGIPTRPDFETLYEGS